MERDGRSNDEAYSSRQVTRNRFNISKQDQIYNGPYNLQYYCSNPNNILLNNEKNPVSWTPLMAASRWNNVDMVRLLLNYGADPRIYSQAGVIEAKHLKCRHLH